MRNTISIMQVSWPNSNVAENLCPGRRTTTRTTANTDGLAWSAENLCPPFHTSMQHFRAYIDRSHRKKIPTTICFVSFCIHLFWAAELQVHPISSGPKFRGREEEEERPVTPLSTFIWTDRGSSSSSTKREQRPIVGSHGLLREWVGGGSFYSTLLARSYYGRRIWTPVSQEMKVKHMLT